MSTQRTLIITLLTSLTLMTAVPARADMPWVSDLPTARQIAAQHNLLVLVHFWAPSCGPCLTLEKNVFSQRQATDAIVTEFVPVKVDGSREYGLVQQFGVRSWPTDVILTPDGQVVTTLRCPQDPGQYVAQLRSVAAHVASTRTDSYPPRPTTAAAGATPPPSAFGPPPARPTGAGSAATVDRNGQFAQSPGAAGGPYATEGYRDPLRREQPPQHASAQPPIADNRSDGFGGSRPPSYQPVSSGSPGPAAGTNRDQYGMTGGRYGQPPPPGSSTYGPGARGPAAQPERPPYGGSGPHVDRGGPSGQNPPLAAGGPPRSGGLGGPAYVAQRPTTATTPRENPPLGLSGHCPVTLITKNQWEEGDARYGAIHRGRTYLFVGPEQQKLFLERPDELSPALSGNDPVEFIDRGKIVQGKREHGLEYGRQIYLFASEATLQQFSRSPRNYAIGVMQAMQQ